MLVCLRFAHIVTNTGARLTTDLPGWALVGRVSHPLDDSSNFLKVITYFLSTGPALLGRTNCKNLTLFSGLDHSLRLSSVALEDVIPAKAGIQCVRDP